MSQPNIQLRIENIVIEGVSRREAERVVRATKEGLERLLTERGLPEALARDESDLRADPSPVRIEASRDSEQMGSRISAAVHQAIRP